MHKTPPHTHHKHTHHNKKTTLSTKNIDTTTKKQKQQTQNIHTTTKNPHPPTKKLDMSTPHKGLSLWCGCGSDFFLCVFFGVCFLGRFFYIGFFLYCCFGGVLCLWLCVLVGIPDSPDERDYSVGDGEKIIKDEVGFSFRRSRKASVDLRGYFPPVFDQGNLGSCTANAAAGIVQYYTGRVFGRFFNAFSFVYL